MSGLSVEDSVLGENNFNLILYTLMGDVGGMYTFAKIYVLFVQTQTKKQTQILKE